MRFLRRKNTKNITVEKKGLHMQFNEYSLYSLNTQDKVQKSQSKIFDDIKRMEKITEYYDILDFIEGNYGKVENHLEKDFSDDICVKVDIGINLVQVVVYQKDKILFGQRWAFTPEEDDYEGNIKFTQPEIKND